MFFSDKVAALRNVGRALRPDGRLVLLVWQSPQRNEWFLELTSAMAAGRALPAPPEGGPHPFSMADADDDAALVAAAGYDDVAVTEVTAPLMFGPEPSEAFDLLRGLLGWMIHGLDDDGRRRALDALRQTIDAHATPGGVRFGSAAWLITARR
jgi:SAM-dependent methyltransferase